MQNVESGLICVGETFERMFKNTEYYPQHRYFTRPIYKFCADKVGSVAATAVSFLAADIVLHQLVPQTIACLASQVLPGNLQGTLLSDSCNVSYSFQKTLYWAAFAIPVMYIKYKNSENNRLSEVVE